MKNPYEILGVTNRSSQSEIKEAYRRLSMAHHPDRGGSATRFIEIKKAYDALKMKEDVSYDDFLPHTKSEPFDSDWKRWERAKTKEVFEQGL